MTPQELIEDVQKHRVPDFGSKDCRGVQQYFKHLLSPYRFQQNPNQLILEFGVFSGFSLHSIAENVYPHVVYGFDTFTGLPEDWVNVLGEVIQPKGFFFVGEGGPPVPTETETKKYVAGLVQDTYPKFLLEHHEPIQFMHVDLDLYGPCKFVLEESTSRLRRNSIVVVDDIANYNGFEVNAAKSFCEWATKYSIKYEPVASCGLGLPTTPASVAFKILHDFC